MNWAERVQSTRERLGLTQTEFARLMGVSLPTVQRWEYGKTEPPYLQSDIIHQINNNIEAIEREEERRNTHIGEILKMLSIGSGVSYGMYRLFEIIFREPVE